MIFNAVPISASLLFFSPLGQEATQLWDQLRSSLKHIPVPAAQHREVLWERAVLQRRSFLAPG